MHSGTQLGFEDRSPHRATLRLALWVWAAGFALAGASAWRMQHPTAGTDEMSAAPTSAALTPSTDCDNSSIDTVAETAELQGAVFMPGDVVVGRRSATTSVTEMQKP
jgi:hypothetical protein